MGDVDSLGSAVRLCVVLECGEVTASEYWQEAVASSLEEAEVAATTEQCAAIASDMSLASENYPMAYGYDVADCNLRAARDKEIEELRKELRDERNKVVCAECRGKGYIIEQGPYHSSMSSCAICRGDGRV